MKPPGRDIAYVFSACETAELAADVEEKGYLFYSRLALEVEAEPIRSMCEFLAGQEESHRKTFRVIAAHYRDQAVDFSYSVDVGAMLRASLQSIVGLFSDHTKPLIESGGLIGCLNLARRIEETSVAVYGHMYRTYTARFAPVLASIVDEEAKHLRMVQNALAELRRKERAAALGSSGVGADSSKAQAEESDHPPAPIDRRGTAVGGEDPGLSSLVRLP
jgi:rubrerythrin